MNIIKYATALFLTFFYTTLIAQKVDLTNAPLNPIPVKYKAGHFNLKGPVFSAGKQVFEENGLLRKELVEYVYDAKGLPVSKGSVEWKTDADGRVIQETYDRGRTTDFTYEGDLLTGAKYHYARYKGANTFRVKGEQTYSYDKQGRLIRETLKETDEENGDTNDVTTYAYTSDGDALKVVKTVQKGDKPPVRTHETYKDGWLIHSRKEGDPIELTIEYTFDSYDNPINLTHVQNNGVRDTFSRSFSYYPELQKENRISFGSENRKDFYPITVFRNGEPADDIVFRVTDDKKTVLIYDEFSNTYYGAPFEPERKPEDETPAQVLIADTDVMALLNGKKIEPYYRGELLFAHAQRSTLQTINGDIISFAASNLSPTSTTVLLEKPEDGLQTQDGGRVLRGKVLKRTHGRFDSHLFYALNEQGNFQLINQGKAVDVRELKKEALTDGDIVISTDDGPKYVMLGAKTNPRPGIYEARYYVPSLDDARRGAQPAESFSGVPGFTAEQIAALIEIKPEELRSTVPQKVDFKKTPVNPIVYAAYPGAIRMKGDVAYVYKDYESFYFDEDGTNIHPKKDYFTSEDEARSHKGIFRRFDNGNKLIRSQGFADNDWTTVYTYTADGKPLAIYAINGDKVITQVREYAYDKQGRVAQYVVRDDEGTRTQTYTYTEKDGNIIIVEESTPVVQDRTSKSVYVYKDGEFLERTDTFNGEVTTHTFTREYDAKGNIAREVNQDGRETQPRYYYHSELESPELWHWKNLPAYEGYSPFLFVGDRKVAEIYGSHQNSANHGVFYEPITQRYLIARNAFLPETKNNPDAGGQMETAITGPLMLDLAGDGKFNLHRYGRIVMGFKQILRTGDEFLLYEPKQNRSYLIRGFQLGQERFYPVEDLGIDATVWYQKDAKSNIVIIRNGEQAGAKGLTNGGAYANGDRLFLKDGKPWMIIEKAQLAAYGKVHKLTPYDGRGRPGEKSAAKAQPKVEPLPYNPKRELAILNTNGGHMYRQMDKPTYTPTTSYKNESGNAFAFYPPNRYHFFEKMNASDFKHDEVREQSRTAIEEHLAEVDGQTVRVWYHGQRLRPEDYSVFDCSNGRKLLCIPSKKMYAQLAPENGFREFRFLMPQWKLNYLIKNEDGSLRLIERGKEVTDGEIAVTSRNGNTDVYIGSDPSYMIRGVENPHLLEPGIYGLDDFSY